jgi:hypothetical protein
MNEEIIFTLNNSDVHHFYSSFSLSLFHLMLLDERPAALDYVDKLGYYEVYEFSRLYERVSSGKHEMPMTLQEVIMFYSSIHFACIALLDDEEEAFFLEAFKEDEEGFLIIRDKLMGFGTVVADVLCNTFLKDNKEFLAAAERIRNMDLFQ